MDSNPGNFNLKSKFIIIASWRRCQFAYIYIGLQAQFLDLKDAHMFWKKILKKKFWVIE